MNFKYLVLGILVGYLAPYALTLIKAKREQANSTNSQPETLFNHDE